MPQVHDDITLGRRLKSWRLGDIAVHRVQYTGGQVMPRHTHAHSNLTFILGGAIEETAEGETSCLNPGDAVIKPAGILHSNRCGTRGVRSIVVEFEERPAWLPPGGAGDGDCAAPYARLRGPAVLGGALRIARALECPLDTARGEVVETVIETIARLADMREGTPGAGGAAQRARSVLHDRFAQPLRVQDLACMLQLHPVYLARSFRREYGCSLAAYRRKLQVNAAARCLLDDDGTLASIAARSGFADQSHMCRAFGDVYGVPPGRFRRLMCG